jgi:hypothetical protein
MRRPLRFPAIVCISVALDIAMHAATADFLPLPADFEGSALVRRFGFGPVALAWAVVAFTGMGLIFVVAERHMTGSGLSKGLRYGLGLGLVVQVAMLEGVAMFGNRAVDEAIVGLSDAVPVLVMGTLLGRFLATNGPPAPAVGLLSREFVITLALFAMVFGSGRLGAQMAGVIDTALPVRPGATIIWTLAMGAAIAFFYHLVQDACRGLAPVPRALMFGLGMFGLNWALFMLFVPMIFPGSLTDVLLRVGLDIALVTLASTTRRAGPCTGRPMAWQRRRRRSACAPARPDPPRSRRTTRSPRRRRCSTGGRSGRRSPASPARRHAQSRRASPTAACSCRCR